MVPLSGLIRGHGRPLTCEDICRFGGVWAPFRVKFQSIVPIAEVRNMQREAKIVSKLSIDMNKCSGTMVMVD